MSGAPVEDLCPGASVGHCARAPVRHVCPKLQSDMRAPGTSVGHVCQRFSRTCARISRSESYARSSSRRGMPGVPVVQVCPEFQSDRYAWNSNRKGMPGVPVGRVCPEFQSDGYARNSSRTSTRTPGAPGKVGNQIGEL